MKRSYIILASLVVALSFCGCSSHGDAVKNLPLELPSVDECLNENRAIENDCYQLISKRNSFAQLRIGIDFDRKKDYKEAYKRYIKAQEMGNFYANALLSNLYEKGLGVPKDEEKALSLLKDVDDVDPMAAFMLSKYYIQKKDYDEAIELLEFAANGNVKQAQKILAKVYIDGVFTKADLQKSEFWQKMYNQKKTNFKKKIYGVR